MVGEHVPSLPVKRSRENRPNRFRRAIAMGPVIGAATLALAFGSPKTAEAESPDTLPKDVIVLEDSVQSPDIEVAREEMRRVVATGATGVEITARWVLGQNAPSEQDMLGIQNAVAVAQEHNLKVILRTYPCPPIEEACKNNRPPLGTWERGKFTNWLANIAFRVPDLQHFVVGNEPNYAAFGWPQNAALGLNYYKFQAASYDVLEHAENRRQGGKPIFVYGGVTTSTGNTSTEEFIHDLGAAYRKSGRKKPIMDFYAHHPYPDNSSQRPSYVHQGPTVGIADYNRLVYALGEAFDGTSQPGSKLLILYNEYGIETEPPPHKKHQYRDKEYEGTKPVKETEQAKNYVEAIGMMACQPNVVGFTLLLTKDEQSLKRWQSGNFYVDGTSKSSLPLVRRAANAATSGQQNCN